MNVRRWIARRETKWQRLEVLLQRVEKKGIKVLKASEIRELASLYRSVSADLARAQTQQVGETLVKDLQRLTSRGYAQIYQGAPRHEWSNIWQFYRWEFPAIVRQTWAYTTVATGIFLLSGLVAWWFAWQDPTFLSLVVPESLIEQVRDRNQLWMGSIIGVEPLASSQIAINNIQVSLAAVGGGITAGIYTIWIMGINGLHIGAIAALVGQNNLAYPFWAFVFPHGSLELPAIFLSGGAGLLIARALLFPGCYRRADALKFYGMKAAKLLFGIVPILLIAGTIEGFFSPNPIVPDILKYSVGLILLLALFFYCSDRFPFKTKTESNQT